MLNKIKYKGTIYAVFYLYNYFYKRDSNNCIKRTRLVI